MPRLGIDKCEIIMGIAKDKYGLIISNENLLRIIKLNAGVLPITYNRYFKDLQEFDFIKPVDWDNFKILKTER